LTARRSKSERAKSERTITAPRGALALRRGGSGAGAAVAADFYSDKVTPATREEMFPVVMGAVLLGFMALIVCFSRGYVLLYGDAVAHLGLRGAFWTRAIRGWCNWAECGCRCRTC